MTTIKKVQIIISTLKSIYPEPVCALTYVFPWQLLISARLSAQCTDKRVNIVTPDLFFKYPTLDSLAAAPLEDVEKIIFPCGLYKTKAKDVVGIASTLINKFNSTVPSEMSELLSLPGVGRKTANLIRGDIFGLPAIVADTHCIRISNRLGLTKSTIQAKVESDLVKIIPPEESSDFCHRLVLFGRDVCKAQNPQCNNCSLKILCKYHLGSVEK